MILQYIAAVRGSIVSKFLSLLPYTMSSPLDKERDFHVSVFEPCKVGTNHVLEVIVCRRQKVRSTSKQFVLVFVLGGGRVRHCNAAM